ncbi:MAG: hypothetical protein WCG05_02585 [Alphaproteobacteria bacterium]
MKKYLWLSSFLFLAACVYPDPVTRELSPYGATLSLDVADVLVINAMDPSPIEQTRVYPSSLIPELQVWSSLRLRGVGQSGKAILRILDARVVEEHMDDLLNGKSDSAALSVNIVLSLEISNAPNLKAAKYELRLSEKMPLTKSDFQVENRATVWQQFVDRILNDLNKGFEDMLYEKLTNVLLLVPTDGSA